jgi:hypothetical protein
VPDDSLRQLLKRADSTPSVPDSARLATSVRRRRVAQQRTRLGASAVAVFLAAALGVMLSSRRPQPVATNIALERTAVLQAELAALRADGGLHVLTAQALSLKDRARRAKARADAQEDPLVQIRFQRDRAAMTLIYEADRFSREASLNDQSIAQYRKVIELFPSSSWADVARQRLRERQSS